jgi:type III secretion system FlhB-like substrate exporter
MSSSKKEDNNLNNKKDLHVKVDNDVKEVKKDIHVKVDNDVKEVKKDIHVKIDNEVKEVKKDLHVKIDNEVKNTKEVVQTEAPKVVAKENQEDIKKIVKEDLHVKIDKETKKSDITRINEVKVESNIPKQQSMVKDLLQTKKPEQAKAESKINPQMMASNEEVKTENLTKETHEIKTDNIAQKSDTKLNVRTESTIQKPTFTNQTFSSFADELREKIEQYKPPIMKVQMALNPKGLGEVDVTIVNRGNNLHVNINSNTTTMNIFTQNQAEFKNSLVNMGFTNLEMNFSDQRENKDNQNGKSSNNQANSFEDEILEDENTSLEIVVPRYV